MLGFVPPIRQPNPNLQYILPSLSPNPADILVSMSSDADRITEIDELDARLITHMAGSPRAGVMDLARALGVARGTAQARLDKLVARGVVTGFGPDIDPIALGYAVMAFTTLEIAQGRLADVVAHLRDIPEVLEAHAITGPGDVHTRLVAHTNRHLQEVLNRVLEVRGINRATTQIVLSEQIASRVLPLVARAGERRAENSTM
jgi:DNA-binding Lrp family transcriptional regulator